MFKIIIFFYIVGTIHSNSEEINEKYIDLLPEAEKQEFLNRIARRILEGIQSDDTPNESHIEITDDQLDQHHAYVQDIINQESENLRNKESKESSRTNDNNYVDYSLLGGKREKRKNDENIETTPEPIYNVIPVKTIYEDYDTISKPKEYNISMSSDNGENTDTKSQIDNNQKNEELHSIDTADGEVSNINSTNLKDDNELSNIKTTDTTDFELHTNDNTTSDNADYEITTVATSTNINSSFSDKTKRKSQKLNHTVERERSDKEEMTLTTDKNIELVSPDAKISNIDKVRDDDSTVLTTDMTTLGNKTNGKTIYQRSGTEFDQTLSFANIDEIIKTSTSISNIPKDVIETTEENKNQNKNTYTSSNNILETDYKLQNNSKESFEFKPKLRDEIVSFEEESKSHKKDYIVYEVGKSICLSDEISLSHLYFITYNAIMQLFMYVCKFQHQETNHLSIVRT